MSINAFGRKDKESFLFGVCFYGSCSQSMAGFLLIIKSKDEGKARRPFIRFPYTPFKGESDRSGECQQFRLARLMGQTRCGAT